MDALNLGSLDIPVTPPGLQQHQTLGIEESHIEVSLVGLVDAAHRLCVSRVHT